jgi:spermidine/putrescine-binding protein
MNNTFVMDAVKEGLIDPVDSAKITHWNDLTPAVRYSGRPT